MPCRSTMGKLPIIHLKNKKKNIINMQRKKITMEKQQTKLHLGFLGTMMKSLFSYRQRSRLWFVRSRIMYRSCSMIPRLRWRV